MQLVVLLACSPAFPAWNPLEGLQPYNVAWDSPSENSSGSMPIGNGEVGINVWAERNGDLVLLLSRTDSWGDNGRLLKLGRIRIRFSGNPFHDANPFRQTLNLEKGEILIDSGEGGNALNLRIWVDTHHPVIEIEGRCETAQSVKVDLELWRKERRVLTDPEYNSAYGVRFGPDPVVVEPDTIVDDHADRLLWYHRNKRSPWKDTLRVQALGHLSEEQEDPLMNLTFGAGIKGDGFVRESPTRLVSAVPVTRFDLSITSHTKKTDTAVEWMNQIADSIAEIEAIEREDRYADHIAWWAQFWKRHWLIIKSAEDPVAAYDVTRGYLLQRFMQAASGRGKHPIKFNGSIFTVDATSPFDPDYRQWGPCYWWQNTRLPYWNMLASGDLDLMEPLFSMYLDALPLATERVRTYYQHEGAMYPETMYFWGTYNNDNYGWNRTGKPDGRTDNRYIRYEWQGGIELVHMMLQRYSIDPDSGFVANVLIPLANPIITFYDEHYGRDPSGFIRFNPSQALETYAEGTKNPTPEIAGLNVVLNGLLDLPANLTGPDQRRQWARMLRELPPLPMRTLHGQKVIAPAEVLGPKQNSESPELYAVFPYTLYSLGRDNLALAQSTYDTRVNVTTNGWSQDVIFAAMLGRTREAQREVVRRFRRTHEGSRFPAMWGPNYDWIPDQTHGGATMIALQKMLLQEVENTLLLFPAWPEEWDVEFRLNAANATVIEGSLNNRRITGLKVSPENRRGAIVPFLGNIPPIVRLSLSAGGRIRLSYDVPNKETETAYILQRCSPADLSAWETVTASPASETNGEGYQSFTYELDPSPPHFYRVVLQPRE